MMGKSLIPLLMGKVENIHANEGVNYELAGSRAYFAGIWKILNLKVPFGTGDWQLYNLNTDPSEIDDLSIEFSEKREELIAGWDTYKKNVGMVFPLN